ncbi:MAG: sugar phosphate nucleotidyltransferase [Candidatus Muiribacteriota bacterium]
MKVIIPVAGIGSRLTPHTLTVPKALVQVAGKEMLAHILDKVKKMENLTEVVFVVGYLGEQIVNFVKKNYDFKSSFVYQKERKGLGHAIYMAMEEMKNEDVEPLLIMLGDTLFEMNLDKVIKSDGDGVIVTSEVSNPQRFGVVVKKENKIINLVEKPEKFVSNRAIIGIYYLKNISLLKQSLKYIIDNNIKTRGEFQLTDALELMLQKGSVFYDELCDLWLDCGKPDTLLATNQKLLDIYFKNREYKLKNSVVIEPVAIPEGAEIQNSVIGPHVSIAEGVQVNNSIIKNSIINKDAVIENTVMTESLIGEKAMVKPGMSRFNISDSSQFIGNSNSQ